MRKLLLIPILLFAFSVKAQDIIPISVKELAPDFGIRPIFLDDTIHVARYLDSLPSTNTSLTDTCVTLNAKLMAMENVMLYDYRHANDTVWIDASHYIDDYVYYTNKINQLSKYILQRAHDFIESEHIRQDNQQQEALSLRKDTIDRYHRSIINACEGYGIDDKERKKELKDIYYSYLSVYNRYDFSMKRKDDDYTHSLDQFCEFQRHLLDNILSSDNYAAHINNFTNRLRVRCGHAHTDVLRSYQRAFRKGLPEVRFSTIREYNEYVQQLADIIDVQNAYMTVIDLREQITATGKRINSLYNPKYSDAAKTYAEVAASINTVPDFNTRPDADAFIHELREFIQVQNCYENDYHRLMSILQHGDTIIRQCGMKYADVAKAYRTMSETLFIRPNYKSIDDAQSYAYKMNNFEYLQRQYDTVIVLRRLIDSTKDTIMRNWMSHMSIANGYQNIRKQFLIVPTFIDTYAGSECIAQLQDFLEVEHLCIRAIKLLEQYKDLGQKIAPEIQPYRNIRRAYELLEPEYIKIKNISHISDLLLYIRQYEAFISVQEHILERLLGNGTIALDDKLKYQKDINKIEALLGL